MRRLLVVAIVALTLAASGGTAHAQSEGACVGTFVSGVAREAGGVGQIVSALSKELHPFGETISGFATTCENPFEE